MTLLNRMAGMLLGGLVVWAVLAGCSGSSEPPLKSEMREIGDDRHRIANPSRQNALATGLGCGGTRDDALKSARRVARFNLRSLTGDAPYHVIYRIVKETAEDGEHCIEMSAQARP